MAADKTKKKTNTAVAISASTSLKLKRLAKKTGVTQGKMVEMMCDFFRLTGFRPDDVEAGKTAISELKKSLHDDYERLAKKVEQSCSNMWNAEQRLTNTLNDCQISLEQYTVLMQEGVKGMAENNAILTKAF